MPRPSKHHHCPEGNPRPKSLKRTLPARDRRAIKRETREALVLVLHPSLFERQVAA